MKWHKKQEASVPAVNNRIAMRGGSYSLIISAVVLAILIVLNIMVTALPTTLTKYDISSSQLYSITSNTKAVVNNLTQDVTIYWIVQADAEDDIIQNLLDKYESLSSYIEVVKKNPDVFPTFTQTYTSENVPNNSLIVESGERYRYVPYDDIYQGEMNYYTGGYNWHPASYCGSTAVFPHGNACRSLWGLCERAALHANRFRRRWQANHSFSGLASRCRAAFRGLAG